MRISLYIITTYALLDTWSRGTKQSQTKPISAQKPLPAQPKTSLTSFFTRPYTTTPQTQKQTQTNPISSAASTRRPHPLSGKGPELLDRADASTMRHALGCHGCWFACKPRVSLTKRPVTRYTRSPTQGFEPDLYVMCAEIVELGHQGRVFLETEFGKYDYAVESV